MSLLQLDDVRKHFGTVQALRGVTFGIEAGEAVGLVGDNGAGKSTLMKTITGVHAPDGGQIHFDGIELNGKHPGEIRALGIEMIYQDLALAHMQDVASNIFLGREPTRALLGTPIRIIDRARMEREAEAMIRKLGARLPSVGYIVGQLSGGQQQSVAIARALTFNPKLVIMDEPTAALGVSQTAMVLNLIHTLSESGVAVLVISHNLNDVFAVADQIAALYLGRVAGVGPASEYDTQRAVELITTGALAQSGTPAVGKD